MKECQSILYVDENPDICEVVQTTLSLLAGLDVETANSAAEAIDLAYELRPDLIILDVTMPGLAGPTTYDRMRSSVLLADMPVIFITAKGLPTPTARFLQIAAIGVISKPFDPMGLSDEVLALWNEAAAARAIADTRVREVQVHAQVESLALSFLERAGGEVTRLRELTDCARGGDRSVLDEIEHLAHSVHGAAAIFGFASVSAAGADLERLVEDLLTRRITPDQTEETLHRKLQECSKLLAQEVEVATARGLNKACKTSDRPTMRPRADLIQPGSP